MEEATKPIVVEPSESVAGAFDLLDDQIEPFGGSIRCTGVVMVQNLAAPPGECPPEAADLGDSEERMVIAIDKIEKMPVRQARMTFTLSGGETTLFTMSYDYEPKGGPLAFILGPVLDRQMNKGFNGFIDYLGPAAHSRAAA